MICDKRKHQEKIYEISGSGRNAQEKTKTIAIFFGVCSTEYEVSLQSACAVIKSIDLKKYNLVLSGISRSSGTWLWYRGETEQIGKDCWLSETTCVPVFASFDKEVHGLCYLKHGRLQNVSLPAPCPIFRKHTTYALYA